MLPGIRLAEAAAAITIAGSLRAMFGELVPANDLMRQRGTDAPTVWIEGMTLAGA